MSTNSKSQTTKFGKEMLKVHFPHIARQEFGPPFNAGAFGIVPECVLNRKIQLMTEFESNSNKFFHFRYVPEYLAATDAAAELIGARHDRCALIDTPTFGTNAALELLAKDVGEDAEILVTSWSYVPVISQAESIFPNRVRKHQIQLPIESVDEFVSEFAKTLDKFPKVKVATFDYISKQNSCQLPVSRLTSECRSRNVKVVLDAAHAIGQVLDLQVESLGVDFFVGSLTKWLMTPKSAALIWASDEFASRLLPRCVSLMVHEEDIRLRHCMLGSCRDISSFFAVPEVIRFIREECGGLHRIHEYCKQLADNACSYLTELWQTGMLPVPDEMQAPFLRMVKLPKHLQRQEVLQAMVITRFVSKVWDFLLNKEKLDLCLLNIDNVIYIRLSFTIVIDMDDIQQLGQRILKWTVQDILRD